MGALAPLGQLPPLPGAGVVAPPQRSQSVDVGRLFPTITPSPAASHRPDRDLKPARRSVLIPIDGSRPNQSGPTGVIFVVAAAIGAAWLLLARSRRRRIP
jgi:hypothetical protein